MKPKPDADLAKFCALLAAPSVAVDEVPPSWFTVSDLSAATNRDGRTVSKKMRGLVSAGKAEAKTFRIATGRGPYPVPHYRLLNK